MLSNLLLLLALAQSPDKYGEVFTDTPTYNGVTAWAAIPPEMHIENEEGTPRGGLCVPSSLLCGGLYQGVPDLRGGKESRLWRTAKSRPGGYAPDRLKALLDEVMGPEEWAQRYDDNDAELERMTRAGFPLGVTMSWGRNYQGKIAHMVTLIHYERGGLACFVDNNYPGVYSWVSAEQFKLRWLDGGSGWAVVWLRKPAVTLPRLPLPLPWLAAIAALAAAALTRRRRVVAVA